MCCTSIDYQFMSSCSIPMTNRGEVTNSLPSFYLATSAGATSTGIRSNNGMAMGPSPYMVQNEHHHQSLGPAFSLQPYAAYPHGVIYQPVMVPPMLFQPGLGMMMSPSPSMTQPQSSRHRPFLHQNVMSISNWPWKKLINHFVTRLQYQSENRHRESQPYHLSSGHVDNPVAGPSYRDDGAANANSTEQNSSYRQQFREAVRHTCKDNKKTID